MLSQITSILYLLFNHPFERKSSIMKPLTALSIISLTGVADARRGRIGITNFEGGFTACGVRVPNSAYAVGVNPHWFDDAAACGHCVTIIGISGRPVTAKVLDTCSSTAIDLNASPAVYEALGYPPGLGSVEIVWEITPCH